MTLKYLTDRIGELAIREKLVNYCASAGSIGALNPLTVNQYPVLFITPSGSHRVEESTCTYTLTLTYIDRLLSGNDNDIDIYSTSIEELKNLINGIRLIDGVVSVDVEYDIRNFTDTEALNDKVSGSYATIRIVTLEDTICWVD